MEIDRDFDEEPQGVLVVSSCLPGGLSWPDGLQMPVGVEWPILPKDFSWPAIFQFLHREVYVKKREKGRFVGYDKKDGNLYEFEVRPDGSPIPYRVTIGNAFVEIENLCRISASGSFKWSPSSPLSIVMDSLPLSQVLTMVVHALISL